jgi:hypothetical protein
MEDISKLFRLGKMKTKIESKDEEEGEMNNKINLKN